jgi:hypothetical protein
MEAQQPWMTLGWLGVSKQTSCFVLCFNLVIDKPFQIEFESNLLLLLTLFLFND